ncbi:T9SS type A sorting domain-containing protein [Chryseobacterium sp.]|jgi:hypothetical protein|uniref:T9SS type A sorting domain-containing protein n=1 Tax=Chryseobacterium sp. TaxID=1871047 RepID=UPI00284EC551|nr:T9SS type A sorting domain-containing protein [Chryseobacterium sp.]MDR3026459.1 T9SS type A sorting domain-containing protein [Chryseobacterium sp.]
MIKNNFFLAGMISAGIFSNVNVKAQCSPVSEFSENFDAYSCCAMGVVPTCWDSIMEQGGNQIISSSSPASGTSNVYQFGYGKISIVVMPQLTNINAGTHHFKFKVRVGSGSGQLDFGYITNINDMSTFVTLESLTITNNSYDSTSERILTVPATVPTDARLAIRNPGTTWAGHYWDDAVWEPVSGLGVRDNNLKSLKIYPNPFHDVLNIPDAEKISTVTISDVTGKIIKRDIKPEMKLQLRDLNTGVYFINLHYKNGEDRSVKVVRK